MRFNPVETEYGRWLSELASGQRLSSDSCRIFHGRGRCYPGLEAVVVDWFKPVLVVTLFSPLDDEAAFIDLLSRRVGEEPGVDALLLQRRYESQPSYECVCGEVPERLVAQRGQLKFALNTDQQNIGFFLDMEPGREWLESVATGKNVLNLFSYTCSFSVLATACGATSVLNMDLSSRSLSQGRSSYRLNNISDSGVKFFANDILKSWGRIKRFGLYDIVICDPPSFQKGSFVASKDYHKILRRMATLCAPNAQLLLCLNSPETSFGEFKSLCDEHLQGFEFEQRLVGCSDFPDEDDEKALKLLVYRYCRP